MVPPPPYMHSRAPGDPQSHANSVRTAEKYRKRSEAKEQKEKEKEKREREKARLEAERDPHQPQRRGFFERAHRIFKPTDDEPTGGESAEAGARREERSRARASQETVRRGEGAGRVRSPTDRWADTSTLADPREDDGWHDGASVASTRVAPEGDRPPRSQGGTYTLPRLR